MNIKRHIKFFVIFSVLTFSLNGGVCFSAEGMSGSLPDASSSSLGVTIPTAAETGLSDRSIEEVLVGILKWLLGVVGIIALISFAISGLMYLLSTGNEKMAENGKSGLMYSIIGVTIALSGFIIIKALDLALRGTL